MLTASSSKESSISARAAENKTHMLRGLIENLCINQLDFAKYPELDGQSMSPR